MALHRVWLPSPNYSSRGGSGVRLVVVHTAEGSTSFRNLGAFFGDSASQVSSHVGIDDERGSIGEYVGRPNKAWTQSAFNPCAVSVELCAAPIESGQPCGASWDAAEWNRHDGMISNLADWIREECEHYGIPITKLSPSQAQGSGHGVCGHVDLGPSGGGHSDPGPNFPWTRVLDEARSGPSDPIERDLVSVAGGPVVLNHDGRLEVFNQAVSGVHHRWQEKAGQGWIPDWANLGGPGG